MEPETYDALDKLRLGQLSPSLRMLVRRALDGTVSFAWSNRGRGEDGSGHVVVIVLGAERIVRLSYAGGEACDPVDASDHTWKDFSLEVRPSTSVVAVGIEDEKLSARPRPIRDDAGSEQFGGVVPEFVTVGFSDGTEWEIDNWQQKAESARLLGALFDLLPGGGDEPEG